MQISWNKRVITTYPYTIHTRPYLRKRGHILILAELAWVVLVFSQNFRFYRFFFFLHIKMLIGCIRTMTTYSKHHHHHHWHEEMRIKKISLVHSSQLMSMMTMLIMVVALKLICQYQQEIFNLVHPFASDHMP